MAEELAVEGDREVLNINGAGEELRGATPEVDLAVEDDGKVLNINGAGEVADEELPDEGKGEGLNVNGCGEVVRPLFDTTGDELRVNGADH